jgi:hypothetical protein
MKHQLDDAVVLQRAERDQLTGGSNNDPEGRVMDEVHGYQLGRDSSLATRCSTAPIRPNVSRRSSLMS